MSNKGKTKYNIKKNGIDICKIVFTKAKDINGRFDIKISFYNEKYKILVHKLFCFRSEEIITKDIENKQISYHYGRDGAVRIHLRNIKEKEAPDQIIYNLVPPNDYSIFPIPLFKIEVSREYKEPKLILNSNKLKHDGIDIDLGEENTVEIFMANPNDKLEPEAKKYESAYILEAFAPIEYFASNGGHVGFEKHRYFFNKSGLHIVKKERQAKDLNLIFNGYYNPIADSRNKVPCITFIENELYEEILLNTLFNPYIENNKERIQGYMPSSINVLNLMRNDILVKDTVGYRICRNLKEADKNIFFEKALLARNKLYNSLLEFDKKTKELKDNLTDKINHFIYTIFAMNRYYVEKYEKHELGNDISTEILWMIEYPIFKIEAINILLGKYLGINNFRIFKSTISYDEKEIVKEADDVVFKIESIKSYDFDYCYMEYNSIFNIHIMNRYINDLLEDEDSIPLVCRGEDLYIEKRKWNNIIKIMKQKKYTCSEIEFRTISIEEEFKNNELLKKVYELINIALNEK